LFLRAVEIDADKRPAWLRDQCTGDEQLERDVQKLLDNDDTRTLIGPNVLEQKTPLVNRPHWLPRWLESIPPHGLMAIGSLVVLLPMLLLSAIVDRSSHEFRNRLRATSLIELVTAKEMRSQLGCHANSSLSSRGRTVPAFAN